MIRWRVPELTPKMPGPVASADLLVAVILYTLKHGQRPSSVLTIHATVMVVMMIVMASCSMVLVASWYMIAPRSFLEYIE